TARERSGAASSRRSRSAADGRNPTRPARGADAAYASVADQAMRSGMRLRVSVRWATLGAAATLAFGCHSVVDPSLDVPPRPAMLYPGIPTPGANSARDSERTRSAGERVDVFNPSPAAFGRDLSPAGRGVDSAALVSFARDQPAPPLPAGERSPSG